MRFEVTHVDKVTYRDTYGYEGWSAGWALKVYDEDDNVVAKSYKRNDSAAVRRKLIRKGRRLAKTHHYSEDIINAKDARAMQRRIEALEKELLP